MQECGPPRQRATHTIDKVSLIDFILNLACLLLWLNWRSLGADPLSKTTPATLAGTLRRAEPQRLKGWHLLTGLLLMLLLRALLYWQIGPAVNWTPKLRLVAIAISFRSDFLERMLLFSGLSFAMALAVFYLFVLLLSFASQDSADPNPLQRFLRMQLGWVGRWPTPLKLLLPLVLGTAFWLILNPVLANRSIIPSVSVKQRMEQALMIGLGSYLIWKYLIGVVLFLSLLSTYVYLGNHWFWTFVATTSRNLLAPLRWFPLRLGKVDFAPIAGMVVVFILAEFAERGLVELFERLTL